MKVIDPTKPNVLPFVGTHAHELSMVLSVLYHELDVNPLQLPFSQVLGHYLYEELVRKKTLGPLPMLSDTLGTPAFVLAASLLLKDNYVFLSFVNSARQDSGDLVDFGTILDKIGYNGSYMASEIDDTATLLKSSLLQKFTTFGAGGFFGDSNKVFDKDGVNISMAVKAVFVECTYNQEPIPVAQRPLNITIKTVGDTTTCKGYPVKTGDPTNVNDVAGRQQISKFSADKLLSTDTLIKMRDDAIAVRENATNILLTPELLSKAKQQIFRDVITMNGNNLIIDTNPLNALVPVFQLAEKIVVVGGGKSKRTTRK
jgi:nicotinic acid phosphoribosyltransferase